VTDADAADHGRAAFERRAWADAYAAWSTAAATLPLGLDDLESFSLTAELVGRYHEATDLLAAAHQEALRQGDVARAAYDAFWLGFKLIHHGEFARGGGWVARAAGLIHEPELDCPAQGYVLLPGALQALDSGDAPASYEAFTRAGEIAARFGDRDLATLARLGRGTSLVAMGERDRGVAYLDEAMVAVTAGEVIPIVAGIVYCATIEACQQLFDLGRAQEWTAALARWCETQPDLVPFRGRCLLYRAELMQLHGAWDDANREVERAYIRLSEPPPEPAVGAAFYQQAELHRLRGAFDPAEGAYRQASQWGRPPEPGLALLRLAQGDAPSGMAMIRRALDEAMDPALRMRLLDAAVELCLALGDVQGARAAADELAAGADAIRAPLLRAMADRARGAVTLATGDAHAALGLLRRAWTTWLGLEAPYEAARTRVLIAEACRAAGDEMSAGLELQAARVTFADLRATPELQRVDRLLGRATGSNTGAADRSVTDGLSARELEVLRLVAAGMTNRAIAEALVISEKTVARHVANIFTKLDLSTRSAATAYAYEHGLQSTT